MIRIFYFLVLSICQKLANQWGHLGKLALQIKIHTNLKSEKIIWSFDTEFNFLKQHKLDRNSFIMFLVLILLSEVSDMEQHKLNWNTVRILYTSSESEPVKPAKLLQLSIFHSVLIEISVCAPYYTTGVAGIILEWISDKGDNA